MIVIYIICILYICMCCVTIMMSCHIGRNMRLRLVGFRYFGLQQPRSAAAAVTAAARPPPLAAGDHGDCGAYSVSILRQGRCHPESRQPPTRALPAIVAESESSHSGVDASRQQLNSSHHANSDRQALKQLMGLKWCWWQWCQSCFFDKVDNLVKLIKSWSTLNSIWIEV